WITGGGSGIGRALARRFVQEGAFVAISGRRADKLDTVCAELEAIGGRCCALPCDVTDEAQIIAAVRHLSRAQGRLDVVVANAGFCALGRVADLSADTWRRQLEVNLIGAAMTVRHALPWLEERGGRVALMSSAAAFLGLPSGAAYGASKAALSLLGATLSVELRGQGVSCTTLHPGFVESEIDQVDNQGRFDARRVDRRPRALMWTAEAAALPMIDAIYRRRRERAITGHARLAVALGRHLPGLSDRLLRAFGAQLSDDPHPELEVLPDA
ncbi:MAG: SDR family oxidoreductase, partial [Myxococcales bacterium]|nr:SDR family oxidoreductase [Myxococcales bacterium]